MRPLDAFVLGLLSLMALLVVGQLYVAIPIAPLLAAELQVSTEAANWITTAFALTYGIGFLVAGPLSDRFGRLAVMRWGTWALVATTACVPAMSGFSGVLTMRGLQGVAAAMFPPAAISYTMTLLPERLRPLGASCLAVSFLLAAPLVQIMTAWLAPPHAPLLAFLPFAVLFGILAVAMLALPDVPRPAGRAPLVIAPAVILRLLRDREVNHGYAAALVVYFSFVGFYVLLTLQADGGSAVDAQFVRTVTAPALLAALLSARLIRLGGPSLALSVGLALIVLGLLIAATMSVLVGALPLSLGVALAVPGLITIFGTMPMQVRGSAVSLYSLLLFVGASIAPPLAAFLARYPAPMAFALFAVPALLALPPNLLAIRRRRRLAP